MARFPNESEGQLAPRFNALVRKETCALVARNVGMGPHLVMAPGEERSGGREKPAILGDACEAVIAALYLDGGMEAAREFVLRHWVPLIEHKDLEIRDAKSALQEWAQGQGLSAPTYRMVARSGPDHSPVFTVEACLSDGRSAAAEGLSLRSAEQAAARILLTKAGVP